MSGNMDFGGALFLMKAGRKVRRAGWLPLWRYMRMDMKKRRFMLETGVGVECVMPINDAMVFANDWQEVK